MAKQTREVLHKKPERNKNILRNIGVSAAAIGVLLSGTGCSPEAGATNSPAPATTAEATPTQTPEVTNDNPYNMPPEFVDEVRAFNKMSDAERKEALTIPSEALESNDTLAKFITEAWAKIYNLGLDYESVEKYFTENPDAYFKDFAEDQINLQLPYVRYLHPKISEGNIEHIKEVITTLSARAVVADMPGSPAIGGAKGKEVPYIVFLPYKAENPDSPVGDTLTFYSGSADPFCAQLPGFMSPDQAKRAVYSYDTSGVAEAPMNPEPIGPTTVKIVRKGDQVVLGRGASV